MDDVLPKQTPEDDYNCGIGVVAAVGIVLCDVIGVNQDDNFKFITIRLLQEVVDCFLLQGDQRICLFLS